jgi:guanylate kinase
MFVMRGLDPRIQLLSRRRVIAGSEPGDDARFRRAYRQADCMIAKRAASAEKSRSAGIARRGLMLVLSSPSGAGKTTLSRKLLTSDPMIDLSVSVTTRPQRPGEVDGRDYRFIGRADFDGMVGRAELLEWAEVFGHCYGTPRHPVETCLSEGRDMLFDIDWQGTQQLRERVARDVVSIFVLPPSIPDLEKRLRSRAQDSDEVIHARMAKAADEMSHWAEYDYVVINQDLEAAFSEIYAILAAERRKRERQIGLSAFVRDLQAKL